MLLGGAILIWRRSNLHHKSEQSDKETRKQSGMPTSQLIEMIRPLSYFAAAMGLALIFIAITGIGAILLLFSLATPLVGVVFTFILDKLKINCALFLYKTVI